METKFTKGEWAVTIDFDSYHEVGPKNERQTMITCDHNKYIGVDRDEALSNAHLIAASPEMYEMLAHLSEMMPFLDEQTHANIEMDAVKHEIDKLLAKARGES